MVIEFNDGDHVDRSPMREPCKFCNNWKDLGYIVVKGGQSVVRCSSCDSYQYMAPRADIHTFLERNEHYER